MLQMPLYVKMEEIHFIRSVCATCLSSNRILHSLKNLDHQFFQLCNGVVLAPEDSICWECKATFTRILQFRNKALQSKYVLTCLLQPDKIPKTDLVKSLSTLTQKLNNTYDAEFEEYNIIKESTDIKVENAVEIKVEPENDSDIEVFTMKSRPCDQILDQDTDSTEETPKLAQPILSAVLSKDAGSFGINVCHPPPWETIAKATTSLRQGFLKDNDKTTENNIDTSHNVTEDTHPDGRRIINVIIKKMNDKEMRVMRQRKENNFNYKNSEFKCVHCLDFFKKECFYMQHMKVHSEEAGPYKCTICQLGFKSINEMQNHNDSHYKIYVCSECGYKNLSQRSIGLHCYTQHRAEFQCRKCDEKFTSKRKLTEHGARAHRGLKTCPICNREFLYQFRLDVHMISHNKMSNFECNICHKKYRSQKSFQNHVNYAHEKPVNPSYCVECDKTFKNEATYIGHLKLSKTHGNHKPIYECAECGKKYPSKSYLAYHIQLVHMRQGKHPCTLCNKVLHTARSLKAHIRSAHGNKKRNIVCHICGKSFTIIKSLREHLNSHQGLRPYQCKVCDATFSYSAALFTHNRLKHLKIKRSCDVSKKRSISVVAK